MLSTESRLPSLDVDIGIIVCRLTGGQLATLCMRHGPRSGFGPECQASADPLGTLPDSRQPRNLFPKHWQEGDRGGTGCDSAFAPRSSTQRFRTPAKNCGTRDREFTDIKRSPSDLPSDCGGTAA